MTATEIAIAIANTLEADNPAITDENKKQIAHACVEHAAAASSSGRSASDCTLLPVFVTGDDAKGPAANDIAALTTRNPTWFMLNHREPVTRPSQKWYANLAEPEPGCADADQPTYEVGIRPECDEFPYWSTLQAHGGSLQTLTPSIRWTRGPENNLQGRKLGKFYGTSGAGDWPAGCNIHPEDAATTVPSMASAFLNVPLPQGSGIKTTWACNSPSAP